MQNLKRTMTALALAAVLPLAACDDEGLTDIGGEDFQVILAPDPGGSASLGGTLQLQPQDADLARIPLDAVDAILLPIGRIEVQDGLGGGWTQVGDVDETIDLLDLPAGGIQLVDAELPEGQYTALRMFLNDDPEIVLNRDIRVGRVTYEAGTHELRIPSAAQAGVRLISNFTMDDGGETLTVLFDDDATVRRVTATGAGTIMISPVLTVRDEDGKDVGEFDDDDDDADDDGEDEEFEGSVDAVDVGNRSFTLAGGTVVVIDDETEIDGDLLSLAAVAEALDEGLMVEAEGQGEIQGDGSILASEVSFETNADS